MRGILIGMTAALNFATLSLLGAWIPVVPVPLGTAVVIVCRLPAGDGRRRVPGRAGVALLAHAHVLHRHGHRAPALPPQVPFALAAAAAVGAPSPVRFDVLTATIETKGGALIGVTGFAGGFNPSNFTFVTPAPPPSIRTPFNGAGPGGAITGGLSSHENGHTLNTAVFSGIVTWINAIDENVLPLKRNSLAYGELTAESHISRGGFGAGAGAVPALVPRQHVTLW